MDDLIKREDVIQALCKDCDESDYCNDVGYGEECDVIKAVQGIPTVQQEHEWIPCAERLPDDDRYVWVYTAYGEVDMSQYLRSKIGNFGFWYGYDAETENENNDDFVVCWMPIDKPQPPKQTGGCTNE